MNVISTDFDLVNLVEASTRSIIAAHHSLDGLRSIEKDTDLWAAFVANGISQISLTEELGGAGFGALGIVQIAKLLGEELASCPFTTQSIIPGYIAARVGDGEFRDLLIDSLVSATDRVSFAGMELSNSLEAEQISTALHRSKLTGEKAFIALPANRFIVTAHNGDEFCLALVDCTGPGVEIETSYNLLNEPICCLRLDKANPKCAPLHGQDTLELVQNALDLGALATAAQLSGISRKAFEITLDYLRTRKQFDQTISSFQALQHRAVDLFIKQKLLESSVHRAAKLFDENANSAETHKAISCAKARAADTAVLMTKETIQMHGAIGFTDEADIGLYARASLCLANQFGSPVAHQRRVYQIERAQRGK